MRCARASISRRAMRAASPSPTMPGTFSAPARLPRSCIPPSISGRRRAPSRTMRAPTQGGAPQGQPPMVRASTSRRARRWAAGRPSRGVDVDAHIGPRPARGGDQRTHVLHGADLALPWCTLTRAVSAPTARSMSAASMRPSASTPTTVSGPPSRATERQAARVAGCSTPPR